MTIEIVTHAHNNNEETLAKEQAESEQHFGDKSGIYSETEATKKE